jgi:hypothetical protein
LIIESAAWELQADGQSLGDLAGTRIRSLLRTHDEPVAHREYDADRIDLVDGRKRRRHWRDEIAFGQSDGANTPINRRGDRTIA